MPTIYDWKYKQNFNLLLCLEHVKKFVVRCGGVVVVCKPILVFSFVKAEQNYIFLKGEIIHCRISVGCTTAYNNCRGLAMVRLYRKHCSLAELG